MLHRMTSVIPVGDDVLLLPTVKCATLKDNDNGGSYACLHRGYT